MPLAFVTGASRGIGLALTEALAERGWEVVAACRSPDAALSLKAVAEAHEGRVRIERLDVTDFEEVRKLARRLDQPIDALVNNAGVAWRDTPLGSLDYDGWRSVMETNLLAPMCVAEAFLEQVAASRQRKIVSISSGLGSIAGTTGGNYFYRSSKAALNMAMRSLARDLEPRGVVVSLLSPGYVDTDFTRDIPDHARKITARQSGQGLADAILGLTLADTGSFRRYNGQVLDW
jgi:NAD(P)-dependent dehydrogenase (short-subunit alcohol dehydrogenase family)